MRQILVVVELDALVEPERDKYGMADLEADILCREVVFKSIYVVFNLDDFCAHLLVRLERIVLISSYLELGLANVKFLVNLLKLECLEHIFLNKGARYCVS